MAGRREALLPRDVLAGWLRKPPRTRCLREFSLRWRPPATGRPQRWYIALWWDGRRGYAAATDRRPCVSTPSLHARWKIWQRQSAWWCVGETVPLSSRAVTKPWGREIWFTGVEKRGVCGVLLRGGEIPLPVWQSICPASPPAGQLPPLIKVLEPLSEPVRGDLYFELHRRKQEVYVVIDVDAQCWPHGTGAIRYGMNQSLRESYGSDHGFLNEFVASAARYEHLRREIDCVSAPASEGLLAKERACRESLEAFSYLQPVRPGDVVQVAPGFPHALQHGVRVLEFQTPVYERMILSFAQRVLTQPNWDTATAARFLQLGPPPAVRGFASPNWTVLAEFDDFVLLGAQVSPGESVALPSRHWALLSVLSAPIVVRERRSRLIQVAPECAVWLGSGACSAVVTPQQHSAQLLLALDRSSVAAMRLL